MLNKETQIDTLTMSIAFSDSIPIGLQQELSGTFARSIIDFNKQADNEFYVVLDTARTGEFIHIDVGEIKYSTTGRSIWVALLDLGLLGADVALL
ncbi:MAG: hypothetical protein HKN79_06755, partial [Flavobacteriales bacterium]|nr:hypothetical protein [Flavobacteriales bacterium]